MASVTNYALEREDKERDAAFNKALHGKSATSKGGISAMLGKGADAKKAAVDEYFKHWDSTDIKNETEADREVRRVL
jgi:sterol 24-C-methyltransferase